MAAEAGGAAIRRYVSQLLLPEIGGTGHGRLRATRALVVGLGGLGSPAALYLAAAGIGTLGLLDSDRVELSNLQRQILYGMKDLERSKVSAAEERLAALNPDTRVVAHAVRLDAGNAAAILAGYDVVLEGSDNSPTKLAVGDAAVRAGIPVVVAAAVGWEGQVLAVRPGHTACYRCVYRGAPPEGLLPACGSRGVLGPVVGAVGCLQAIEALKLVLGLPTSTAGRLLLFDGAAGTLDSVAVRRDRGCPACGEVGG